MSDEEYDAARSAALRALLTSRQWLKLIVAGPGTGKTYTFQQLLAQTEGKSLAITFLTLLVEDLKSKFDADRVQVSSFHGLAKQLLHRVTVVASHGWCK